MVFLYASPIEAGQVYSSYYTTHYYWYTDWSRAGNHGYKVCEPLGDTP